MSRYMDILEDDVGALTVELVYDVRYVLLVSRDGMR